MRLRIGDYVRAKNDTDGHIYRVVNIIDADGTYWIRVDPMDGWLRTASLMEDFVFVARQKVDSHEA